MPYGMLETVQLSAQNSLGTLNVSSLRAIALISEGLNHTVAQLQEAAFYGQFGESPRYGGMRQSGGPTSFEPKPTWLGAGLYATCGRDTVAFTSSLATHKFRPLNVADWDPVQSALPPYSILVDRQVGSSMTYWDMVVNKLSLSIAAGQLLKADLTWIGGQYADQAKVAAVYPSMLEAPWNWGQASLSYNGVAVGQVTQLQMDVDNNLELKWTLTVNSGNPTHIKRKGPVIVSGTATILFTSNSFMAVFLAQSRAQFLATFQVGSYLFKIDMPQFRPTGWDVAGKAAGVIEATMPFVAEMDPTSSYQAEFTLANTVAVYP